VTALYEVVPRPDAPADAPWMTVSLRYKPPKGEKSSLLELPVAAESRPLASTSDDFRFSAAVASFGMLLRDGETGGSGTWATTYALARDARGDDSRCRRHRFLELVGKAAVLAGDDDPRTEPITCPADEALVAEREAALDEPLPRAEIIHVFPEPPEPEPEASQWSKLGPWVLEVMRLLPPLLALPLFVMALRRPRRRT
jgi:hypothetical protein